MPDFSLSPQVIIEVLDAAHLTAWIETPDFPKRGGIMLIGPPGAMKTALIEGALDIYPSVLKLSDLNINSLMSLRDELISGRFKTMTFPEFEKLYQRRSDTATNIEGTIKQLVEDGFTRASFEPQGMISMNARACIIGAMTYSFYGSRFDSWKKSGFARRFIWASIRLRQPDKLMDSVDDWKRIPIDGIQRKPIPVGTSIPFNVTDKESTRLRQLIQKQAEVTPFVLIKKIFAVLKWKHGPDRAMRIMDKFSLCLNGEGLIDFNLKGAHPNGSGRTESKLESR